MNYSELIYKYTLNTFNSFTFNLSSTQSNLHSHHMIRLRSLVFRVSCHSESFLPFQPDGTSIFGLSPLPLHPHLNSITSDLSLVLATSTRAPMRCASCGLSKSNDSPPLRLRDSSRFSSLRGHLITMTLRFVFATFINTQSRTTK